jgi:hypothetical protein
MSYPGEEYSDDDLVFYCRRRVEAARMRRSSTLLMESDVVERLCRLAWVKPPPERALPTVGIGVAWFAVVVRKAEVNLAVRDAHGVEL